MAPIVVNSLTARLRMLCTHNAFRDDPHTALEQSY
jgi:hypothetical protein